ncbi:MAG TPA: cytochrome c [Polyangia bacterium]
MNSVLWLALLLVAPLSPQPTATAGQRPADPKALPGDLLWMIGPREGAPTAATPKPTAKLRARGRQLYETACSTCHGVRGDGQGEFSDRLRPRPTDFTRAVYKIRSTPSGSLPTDEDLFGTITRGMHGTAMLRWPQLTERDRWALVFHLKSLSPRFRKEPPGRSIGVPIPPQETQALRERGLESYVRLKCGTCHGDTGAGDGKRPDGTLTPSPRNFTRGRFIRGAEMEDIYVTLRVGLEGTHMASYDAVPDDEIWALAAYVRSLVRERPLNEIPLIDPEKAAKEGFGH